MLFEDMDDNGDGLLTLAEILEAPRVVRQKLGEVFGLPDVEGASKFIFEENVTRLFNDLDTDGSGAVRGRVFLNVFKMVSTQGAAQAQFQRPCSIVLERFWYHAKRSYSSRVQEAAESVSLSFFSVCVSLVALVIKLAVRR